MKNADSVNTGPLNVIGKPFRKVDARAKCTGQTKFADDIVLPRCGKQQTRLKSGRQTFPQIADRLVLQQYMIIHVAEIRQREKNNCSIANPTGRSEWLPERQRLTEVGGTT